MLIVVVSVGTCSMAAIKRANLAGQKYLPGGIQLIEYLKGTLHVMVLQLLFQDSLYLFLCLHGHVVFHIDSLL